MPTHPAICETLQKYQNFLKTEWVPIPENFDIDEGDFDYSLNSMDIEENSGVARGNPEEIKSQGLEIAAVIKSNVNIRKPSNE